MSSIIKVDTIQNQSGANIISESANTITVGASGDTITIPSGATLTNNGTVTGINEEATTVLDTWYINTNMTGGATTLTTNWSQWSGGGYARLSSMTQSSGVFSFPETGIYYIDWQAEFRFSGESRYNEAKIQVTTDNSSYSDRAYGYGSVSTSGGTGIINARTSTFVDVTDTSLVKVKFGAAPENASATLQSSTGNYLQTRAIFMKVANT